MSDSPPRTGEFIKLLAFVGLGIGVGIGVLQPTTREAPDAELLRAHIEQGMSLQRSRQTDAAVDAYRAALALDPNHVPALYELGWASWVLGDWPDVVQSWERVLQLEPAHAGATKFLAEARANLATAERLDAERRLPELGPEDVPREGGATFRFAFGGDTMMGSPLTRAGLPGDDGASLFDAYRETMRAADLTFLNLEGTLLDDGKSHKCKDDGKTCDAFRTPVGYVKNLVDAGVDAVSTANDRAGDFAETGRKTTWKTLRDAGILPVGPVHEPAILDTGGKRIGFLAFATSPGYPDVRDADRARRLVEGLAPQVDLMVVSFHGGAEGKRAARTPNGSETFRGENRGDVRRFAHTVVDAGADIVVGHGPHVLRGIEIYKERLIAYSLGNFVTYGGFDLRGPHGLSALLLVDLYPGGRFASGRVVSGKQVPPGGGVLDPEYEAARTIAALSTTDFGERAAPIEPDGTILGPASKADGGGHAPNEGDDDFTEGTR